MPEQQLTQQQIRDMVGCKIKVGDVVTISDAEILWPNFSGAADKYNSEGDRNFNLRLSKTQADELADDGWSVKCKLARPDDPDQDGEERCVLKITVKFTNKPPKITMIGNRSKSRTLLDKETASNVDSSEIATADISFVPYFWNVNGDVGVTAYLKTAYIVIVEDELDEKWALPSEDV